MAETMPLQQFWLGSPQKDFRPGWARARWDRTTLYFDLLFAGDDPRNAARSLNECTWQLGAVAEIFLMLRDSNSYLELHVTPENQRLQLRWPLGAITEVRAGKRTLHEFMVWDADWVQSTSRVTPGAWRVSVAIPIAVVDARPNATFHAGLKLLTNVSRYDYGAGAEPVLSATAPLREAFYHRWEDWHEMTLIQPASSIRITVREGAIPAAENKSQPPRIAGGCARPEKCNA